MTRTQAMKISAAAATSTFLLTIAAVWAITLGQTRAQREVTPPPPPAAIPHAPAPEAPSINLRDTNDVRVYKAVKDAVVNITSSHTVPTRLSTGNPMFDSMPLEFFTPEARQSLIGQARSQSLGSGFVIHPAGYIITNEHVIDQGTEIQCVFVNGEKLPATVIATDNEHDLAVLKVNPKQPLPALTLGTSEDLMIGEPVYAIGNPFGLAGSMTRGIISALNRTLEVSKDKSYKGLIQTDASINPGNSGGPLLNAYGQVIGVNSAIRADAQGIGFAIAVSNMRDLLPDFLNPEALNRAQVGFSLEEVRSLEPPAKVSAAVLIKQVQPGSDADKAGVKPGDKLVQIGNTQVKNIVDALVPIATANPGDKLQLKFERVHSATSHTEIQATVSVAKPPPPPSPEQILAAKMGITAQTLNQELATKLKVVVAQGIYVATVQPNSAAARTGLQTGDVLLQLGQYRVNSIEEVAAILRVAKVPVDATIGIVRGNTFIRGTISLK